MSLYEPSAVTPVDERTMTGLTLRLT